MARFRAGLLSLAVSLTALAGCTSNPAGSPSPLDAKPTFSCIPEAGGAPQPCYERDYDLSRVRDQLYADAEVVLRKRLAESERIYRAGGVTEATPVMLETTTGEALGAALGLYQSVHRDKTRAVGGEFRLGYVRRAPGLSKGGSVVALESCVDASSVEMRGPGSSSKGTITAQRTLFSKVDGVLKASYTEWKSVESCS